MLALREDEDDVAEVLILEEATVDGCLVDRAVVMVAAEDADGRMCRC